MKNIITEDVKITIKYKENNSNWNNLVDCIISFMIDSNILGEINEKK